MKIYKYIGGENNQDIKCGEPFLVIGFCDGEWELSKTNWNDVKNNHDAIQYLHDNLMVDLCINPIDFEKYFSFDCEIK